MPVNTVSADDVVYVDGKRTFRKPINKGDRGGRGGRGNGRGGGRGGRGGRRGYGDRAKYKCRAEQLQPRYDLVTPGKVLAFDCEGMQLPQPNGRIPKGVGRVSVVNEKLELVYDTFVHYGPDVEHRPDPPHLNLGVKAADIKPENGAQLYEDVLKVLKTIFDKSGVLVAHDFRSDRRMLKDLDFSNYDCNDTQHVSDYRDLNNGNPPALRMLVSDVLGKDLDRSDGHSSIDDARVTMELWLFHTTGTYPGRSTRVQPGRNCKTPRRGLTPGNLVALPYIASQCPPNHVFDPQTSTFIPKMRFIYELGTYVPWVEGENEQDIAAAYDRGWQH